VLDGKSSIKVKGKGDLLTGAVAGAGRFTGVLKVQLQRTDGSVCWGAHVLAAVRQAGQRATEGGVRCAADDGAAGPVWSAIHSQVIGRLRRLSRRLRGLSGLGPATPRTPRWSACPAPRIRR
jgi:hypothetical protein